MKRRKRYVLQTSNAWIYLSNYAIDDGRLTSTHQVLCDTNHVPRSCWGSRAEPQGGGLHKVGTITVKFFFLSLSLSFCTRNRTGQPIYLLEYNNNCNNTLHAPIRSHADNVARIKRKKGGRCGLGYMCWVFYNGVDTFLVWNVLVACSSSLKKILLLNYSIE